MGQQFFNASMLTRVLAQAAKSILALSATVSLKVLDETDAQGNYRYARGRYKYFGLGALVIFFAVFSGYGMAHMLATMANVSTGGAITAGCLWTVFQWCLERQMIMSIHTDASWPAKAAGLSWRAMLALLSALTMVYPFFVDSNRAEIAVKTGELTRQRLLQNLSSAQAASDLPAIRQDAAILDNKLQQAGQQINSDPPQLSEMQKQWQYCLQQARETERRGKLQLSRWRQNLSAALPAEAAILEQKISHMQAHIQTAKNKCSLLEQEIHRSQLAWKNEKLAEKNALAGKLEQVDALASKARLHSDTLEQAQAEKIEAASHAGFSADFAATWAMLQNDEHKRLQFIWWLLWFLTIEMVAILVKFTSHTDVDARLNANEYLLKLEIDQAMLLRRSQIKLAHLRQMMQIRGEQAALHADDGKTAAAIAMLEHIHQLEQQAAGMDTGHYGNEVHNLLRQAVMAINASFMRLFTAKPLKSE